ncbi:MAG: hypothetical protein ACOX52_01260 [Verrucomicrobiota bacterium]
MDVFRWDLAWRIAFAIDPGSDPDTDPDPIFLSLCPLCPLWLSPDPNCLLVGRPVAECL